MLVEVRWDDPPWGPINVIGSNTGRSTATAAAVLLADGACPFADVECWVSSVPDGFIAAVPLGSPIDVISGDVWVLRDALGSGSP